MLSIFSNDQTKSALRTVGVSAGSILAALSIITPDQFIELKGAFQNVWDGLTLISNGIYVIVPIGLGAWGVIKSSLKSQTKSVTNSGALVVTPKDGGVTPELANAIANLPDTHKVVTTPAVAVSVPSEKVVAP